MSFTAFQVLLLATFSVLLVIPVLLTVGICRRRGYWAGIAPLILVPGLNVAVFYWLAMTKTPDRAASALWPAGSAGRRQVLRAIGLAPIGLLAFKARVGVAAEFDIMSRDAMARIGRHYLDVHPLQIGQACDLARKMGEQDFAAWRTLAMRASRLDLDAGNTAVLHGFVLPRGLLDVCAGWSVASNGSRHDR